ncbi:MAG: hypothetical protein IJK64_11940 [Clostridia bacterium]|nr:hypothetical protein [Clostridia bacterium]
MKKLLSVLLCAAIVCSTCALFAAGAGEIKDPCNDYPVILVAGYSSSSMYCGDDPETGEQVWGVDVDEILQQVLGHIAEIGRGLGALTLGNAKVIADTVGNAVVEMYGDLACNPDGTSVNNIHTYASAAKDVNSANILAAYPDGDILRHETVIEQEIAAYIGYENIYHFQCDFRMGQLACAEGLDALVEDVLAYTGKDRVNIFAVSHGGQTVSTYLALYGYKNHVHNAVLTVPAIGGAALAYDPLADKVKLDEECLIRFIEHGNQLEEDYDWLVKAQQLGFLDDIIHYFIPYLLDVLEYWGSMWDFLPPEYYEEVKAKLLDPVESARLIALSDEYHYQVQPTVAEKFRECQENGTNILILAGTGHPAVTGLQESSDAIITVKSSTGATCAPIGQRFADGYTQINDCGGKYKVSPAMDIDASTCYLPDHTWFVDGLFHGMTLWDDYTRVLMVKMTVTDTITDVYADPAYPQFHYTTNPSSKVYFEFTNCAPGYITDQADGLTVTNICQDCRIRLTGVDIRGADVSVQVRPLQTLQPGESVTLPLRGAFPTSSKEAVDVTVYYTVSTVTPANCRTETFTLLNGSDAVALRDYTDTTPLARLSAKLGAPLAGMLQRLGLAEFTLMLLGVFSYWTRALSLR